MKKTLGKKVEMGMKLVPIPLSLLLAGTMAVTVQADEVNNETEGNQVQNNQATPPVNQELQNDGTIKNTPNQTEGSSGLTISEQGENGAAQVSPEIKQLAQEFYDFHTKGEIEEFTKAATMTSVMPEIQSVEQIEEEAKKYDHAYAIRKMDGVFKYIDLKQVENLNLVKDDNFQEVRSSYIYPEQSLIQNNTALFFLNKWESIFNPNPTPEEVAKIPKAIIPRSELDLTLDDTIHINKFLNMLFGRVSGMTFEEGFSRIYLPDSNNRVLSMKEIKQIFLKNPDMFRIDAGSSTLYHAINPFFQKLFLNGKEIKYYDSLYNREISPVIIDPRLNGYSDVAIRYSPFDYSGMMPISWDLGKYNRKNNFFGSESDIGNMVYIDWLGNNPSLTNPWFGRDNVKTFHYKLYLMKPGDKTRYYIDRDYTIEIAGFPWMIETPDGGLKKVDEHYESGSYTVGGYEPDQHEIDKLFRSVKTDGFVFKLSDVKKVREGETDPGKVLVRYQDEQGNVIANPITDEQPGKTRYTVSPKPLISYKNQLYTYKSRLANTYDESGEYEAGMTKEIVYVYMRNQFQLPNDAPSEERPVMEMTRFVDENGQEISAPEQGLVASKSIINYDFQSSSDEDGIRTHVYRASVHEVPSDSPSEDKPVMEMTRFIDESGQELSAPEQGLVASKSITGYDFQSSTEEDGIRTHVYRASVHEVPSEAPSKDLPILEMTRFVDESGQELSDPERGLVASKSIANYDFQSSSDEDGIRTHVYRASVHELPSDAPIVDKPAIEITRFLDVDGRPLAAAEFGLLDAKDFEKYGFVSVTDANGVRTYVYAPKTKTQIALGTEISEQKSPVRVENSETTPVLARVSKHQLPNTGSKNSSFLGAAIISLLASFSLLYSKKEQKK
ncbi:LPXTG cell wall anchor domain protein [Streptococcus sp. AS14]|jgi:von willebrand factor-binding protein, putative|uniref:von Willebrand factor-binding protein n=1 Tax=Streptococcus sanguinis SK160 TaxID=888812 RepID=F0IUJ4_STRSA|nr:MULTISPECIES: MucBP domain-containing protein [Streptococcus]EGD38526.1 von Willebrand factor-binding protein precursor [Streptococcus sanguinis SK160]EJO18103.1 LPXTG cell wall anchor domain protein [Streptococcus sp. AS14]MBZ2026687.1 MucBP domain-containing protein [Streptococcus sanguinis]RSI00910.1 Gram positive anchor [Streptococcus sanguinis]RSI02990.1 Gram positive anchor [Streptococcus sanguinis]